MRSVSSRLTAVVHVCRIQVVLAVAVGALTPSLARAHLAIAPSSPTSAIVVASLSPDRLGARAALTVTIHYSGGQLGVPSPVRLATVKFPAGLTLEIPRLRSCSLAHLRARGADGCPAASRLGTGHALAVVRAGSESLAESVALTAFLGPLRGFQPTLLILAQGYTPLEKRVVLTGEVLPAAAPYGEEMVMAIPDIPTLPLEPDASLVTFSLTVGADSREGRRDQDALEVPAECPLGGFPFAAEFTYADATDGSALGTIPCPS
jgi:hypothetical protein